MCMRYIVICGLPRSTIFFHIFLINGTIYETKLLNTKCVFWFSLQLLSETFLILRRTERDIIKKIYIGLHVKYRLFLSDFNEIWILATNFRKNSQISNFIKIRPVGSDLFHTDGQTGMAKLIVIFRNFANVPKTTRVKKAVITYYLTEDYGDIEVFSTYS
jgi:hypothetical protein